MRVICLVIMCLVLGPLFAAHGQQTEGDETTGTDEDQEEPIPNQENIGDGGLSDGPASTIDSPKKTIGEKTVTLSDDFDKYEREQFEECRDLLSLEQKQAYAATEKFKRLAFIKRYCMHEYIFEACRSKIDSSSEDEYLDLFWSERHEWLKNNCTNTKSRAAEWRINRLVTNKLIQCKERLPKSQRAQLEKIKDPYNKWDWMLYRCPPLRERTSTKPLSKEKETESSDGVTDRAETFAMLVNAGLIAEGLIHKLWTVGPEFQIRINQIAALDLQIHYAGYDPRNYPVGGFSMEGGLRIAPMSTGLRGLYLVLRIGALILKSERCFKENEDDPNECEKIKGRYFTPSLELGYSWIVQRGVVFNLGGGVQFNSSDTSNLKTIDKIAALINLSFGLSI
ncbi:MAG: hypothetical protein GY854_11515 [Deltaproteobacteria bacterium]|nr:hypothetical protein [Deltaproteobacteria bacterium]